MRPFSSPATAQPVLTSSRTALPSSMAGVGLAALLASVLQGCCFSSTCDCEPTERQETHEGFVNAAAMEAALLDGALSLAECVALCDSVSYHPVLSCADLGPVPASSGTGGNGGQGGSVAGQGGAGAQGGAGGEGAASGGQGGNEPQRVVSCVVDATGVCEGRRHAAVVTDSTGSGPTPLAAWLSRAARAEAASVPAFLALADELCARAAPAWLVRAARAAAGDEVRHARLLGGLAAAAGAPEAAPPVRTGTPARTLLALALENAVEGCVHETFAALVAMHQARHASDTTIRRVMARVAADELRHGELAWAIHHWACSRLDVSEVAAVEEAMLGAADALTAAVRDDAGVDAATRRTLGLPEPARAAALVDGTALRLWRATAA